MPSMASMKGCLGLVAKLFFERMGVFDTVKPEGADGVAQVVPRHDVPNRIAQKKIVRLDGSVGEVVVLVAVFDLNTLVHQECFVDRAHGLAVDVFKRAIDGKRGCFSDPNAGFQRVDP